MRRYFPAIFARGGTSNGLVIHRHHLPPLAEWHSVLPSAMGSPDPYGRQLDGMGSGISSTSKICVLSPSSRPDADVDFTFVQVGIRDGAVDMAGNCGNMSSIVGPVGLDEGLISRPRIERGGGNDDEQTALVRIFNTNTSKLVHSRFKVAGHPARYCPDGDYEMDGVPGKGSKITLSFLDPAGAKTGEAALPTGRPIDTLRLPDGSSIEASLVDVSNPGVFVRVADLGMGPGAQTLSPLHLDADSELKRRLEQIRQAGASMMGLDPRVESVPKIVLLLDHARNPGANIECLALSMGQAHKAVPLTLALCLGAAVKLDGTIPNLLAKGDLRNQAVVIAHPSGTVDIGTTMKNGRIQSADLHRTARVLMKGDVFY